MTKKDLKIVFLGTPEFAVESLDKLVSNDFNIVSVVTMPDKQAGRGHQTIYSDVKKYALEKGLKILQPQNLKSPEFIDELKKLKTDNPNSFKALKIRTMLGSGINFYREYCKSNTVKKSENKEFVTTFFHDQKPGAYSVR